MPTLDRQEREILDALLSVMKVTETTVHGGARPVLAWRFEMTKPVIVDNEHFGLVKDRVRYIVED